jgi:hypothetical protein
LPNRLATCPQKGGGSSSGGRSPGSGSIGLTEIGSLAEMNPFTFVVESASTPKRLWPGQMTLHSA